MFEFLDDDEGYLAWLDVNQTRYVLNIRRIADPNYVVLHKANYDSISIDNRVAP